MNVSQSTSATASSSRNATTSPLAMAMPVFLPPDSPCNSRFSTTIVSGSADFSRS